MITLALISAGIGVATVVLIVTGIRIWLPTAKMSAVFWPLRVPNWIAWAGIPMSILGLLLWTIGIAANAKGVRRWGAGMAQWGIGGFLGGWLGGIGISYLLQFLTGWPPPSAEVSK